MSCENRAVVERSHLYALLAAVFRRPLDGTQLERLRAPEVLAALAAAGVDPGEDFADAEANVLLDRLAIDYTQLFHAPGGRIAPYECLQAGQGDQLMGSAAHAVRGFLADVGYLVLLEGGELPDHISVELAFMSDLAGREGEALLTGDSATAERATSLQRQFLGEHLGRWAARFGHAVAEAATTPFYRSMAMLLASFIIDECETA